MLQVNFINSSANYDQFKPIKFKQANLLNANNQNDNFISGNKVKKTVSFKGDLLGFKREELGRMFNELYSSKKSPYELDEKLLTFPKKTLLMVVKEIADYRTKTAFFNYPDAKGVESVSAFMVKACKNKKISRQEQDNFHRNYILPFWKRFKTSKSSKNV